MRDGLAGLCDGARRWFEDLWDLFADEFAVPALLTLPFAALSLVSVGLTAHRLPWPWAADRPWTTALVVAAAALVAGTLHLTPGFVDALAALLVYAAALVAIFLPLASTAPNRVLVGLQVLAVLPVLALG